MTTTIDNGAIEVRVPFDALAVTTAAQAAEADLATIASLGPCADDATLAFYDALMTEQMRDADKATAIRKGLLDEIKAGVRKVEAHFRTWIAPRDAAANVLKRHIADYALAKAEAARAAQALALEAAKAADDATMAEALTVAEELERKADVGARTRFVWRVKRVIADLLPDEYWCPDEVKIGAIAKAWPGDSADPPVVPGVVFEREALVAGKHK